MEYLLFINYEIVLSNYGIVLINLGIKHNLTLEILHEINFLQARMN